jgi:hypothetical protein
MTLRYLLDEQLRGPLWNAVSRHNRAAGPAPVDAARLGDPHDLPLGSLDPDILVWCEREGRVLVSQDYRSMPAHLAAHLRAGRQSPGIFLLRVGFTLPQIVDALVFYAYAAGPHFIQNSCDFIP